MVVFCFFQLLLQRRSRPTAALHLLHLGPQVPVLPSSSSEGKRGGGHLRTPAAGGEWESVHEIRAGEAADYYKFHKRTSRSVCVTLRSDQSGFLETFSPTNSNCKRSVIKTFHWNLCENFRGRITVPLRQRLVRRDHSHVHCPKHQRAQIHVDDQRVSRRREIEEAFRV